MLTVALGGLGFAFAGGGATIGARSGGGTVENVALLLAGPPVPGVCPIQRIDFGTPTIGIAAMFGSSRCAMPFAVLPSRPAVRLAAFVVDTIVSTASRGSAPAN